MKSELKMQYLSLKLKISGMVARLQEFQGTLVQKQAELDDLQQKLALKSEELVKTQRRLKELEKNFKKTTNFLLEIGTNGSMVYIYHLKSPIF